MQHKALVARLGIGTVQFGLDYGISNTEGQVARQEVINILDFASNVGITTIDTAAAYGNAEEVLGTDNKLNKFELVTKLRPNTSSSNLSERFQESLTKLNCNHVHGLLLHDYNDLTSEVWKALEKEKFAHRVTKIGYSVYHPWQLIKAIDNNMLPDIVQLPYNLLDRRFESLFKTLAELNIEVHVRSIFLQGFFFLKPDVLQQKFGAEAFKLSQDLNLLAKEHSLSISSIMLNFVLLQTQLNKAIIGVQSLKQLEENVGILAAHEKVKNISASLQNIYSTNENIILPINWN